MIARFRADLLSLTGDGAARLGVAVSGGPDSLALLLLAAAAFPGQVEAATVDHGLRPESVEEARAVADICALIEVPHAVLTVSEASPPTGSVQAWARTARYAALSTWAAERGLSHLATAHHADDQAETILLRLARGAGLAGLAATRPVRPVGEPGLTLVRPLLGWRKAELAAVVAEAGLHAADDPSNRDPRYDRSHARELLAQADWIDPRRVAASAAHLAEAEQALAWAAHDLFARRAVLVERSIILSAADLPPELQRRLLLIALERFGCIAPPGPKVMRALALLRAGRRCTLAGVMLTGGASWRLTPAPARNDPPR